MDDEDRRMQTVERDAEPERWAGHGEPVEETLTPLEKEERREALSRAVTASTMSTSSAESASDSTESGTDGPEPAQSDYWSEHEKSDCLPAKQEAAAQLRRRQTLSTASAGQKEYVVEFDGPEDPLHAQNWPLSKKLPVALVLGYVTLTAAFGSSIFSAALSSVAEHFHVSTEVGILGISLYVLGFATGPLLWVPFSELYGRKIPLLLASFGFSVFSIAVAVAKDAQTVFICRFFGGFFGASPFIGGFIDMSYLGWRWTEYLVAIMGFAGFGLSLSFLEETYPPIILVNKASELRRRTKNWGIHAKQEEIEIDFRELVEKNLSRPMRMLFTEPIVLALSIYMAFVYGLLYLFLTFYPIVFQKIHGMNKGVGSLPYFGMILGELIAGLYMVLLQPSYNRKLAANNNIPIPEWRMPPAIIGGVLFALGLFWFGWTGYRADIHWIAPTLSGLFTGFGIMSIFLQCLNYLIDSYLMFAASAIAANTFLRSLCGAVFPLFATYMYEKDGSPGAKIRERSSFAPTFPMANQANAEARGEDPEKTE
ncbi:hypothetical protein LTR36_005367 [Oleoguttula mirabilis]|uniref:Cercosporin MFS transporter CTB4 n=1 Tax=Oleoguttula mirabilis TaxID=1507867 RepID=A0AAV9JFP6_9PEZI|nr:hypothetical protein LTR36_005367 [Oleoguttula mirabilis]